MTTTTNKEPLQICSKCQEPKQYELPNGHRVRISCKCEREEQERERQRQAEQERLDRVKELQKRIPPEYRNCTFENDDNSDKNTTALLKRYVAKIDAMLTNGQGLLLFGSVGTGKTYGAMCIANALVQKGYRVGCTTLAKIVTNAQDWDNAEWLFNDMLSNQIIIIDDLGTQRSTEFANEKIYEFIDECTKKNRCLIITTNLTPNIFEDAITQARTQDNIAYARIYSRILACCYPIKINSVKRRAIKQTKNNQAMQRLLGGE